MECWNFQTPRLQTRLAMCRPNCSWSPSPYSVRIYTISTKAVNNYMYSYTLYNSSICWLLVQNIRILFYIRTWNCWKKGFMRNSHSLCSRTSSQLTYHLLFILSRVRRFGVWIMWLWASYTRSTQLSLSDCFLTLSEHVVQLLSPVCQVSWYVMFRVILIDN